MPMDPQVALNDVINRCLDGINSSLDDLQDEYEDAELDELKDQLGDTLPNIRCILAEGDQGEEVAAVVSPFYTLSGIPPSSVRVLEEIEPGGMLVLAAGLRLPDGRLTRFLSNGRDGASMVLPGADARTIIRGWRKSHPRLSPFADYGVHTPNDLLCGADGKLLGETLWKAYAAAVHHATRWYPEKAATQAVSRVRQSILPRLCEISEAALSELAGECEKLVDPVISGKIDALGIHSLGGYNFLVRSVDEELLEKRTRVIETFPRFAPILTDFTQDRPGCLAHEARAVVDAGEPLRAFMARQMGCSEKVMKHFLSMDLPSDATDRPESPATRIQNVVSMLQVVPNQRWPKTQDEIRVILAMPQVFSLSKRAAAVMGIHAAPLWEGALKQGWEPMVKKFSALRSLDRMPHPPDPHLTGNLISYALQTPIDFVDLIGVAVKHKRLVLPDGVSPEAVVSMLFDNKTLFRYAEFADWYERVRAEISAKTVTKGADCTWFPLFPKDKVQEFDGVEFVELTSTAELVHEGSTMHHCVGGYTYHCLERGDRIFHVTDTRAPENAPTERVGTLDLSVSEANEVKRIQFLSVRDHQVGGRLQTAVCEFIQRINAGELRADLAAHQRDIKMKEGGDGGSADLLSLDVFDAINNDSGSLLPKNVQGITLAEYIHSDTALEWMRRRGILSPEDIEPALPDM